jgi:hypothetical protein
MRVTSAGSDSMAFVLPSRSPGRSKNCRAAPLLRTLAVTKSDNPKDSTPGSHLGVENTIDRTIEFTSGHGRDCVEQGRNLEMAVPLMTRFSGGNDVRPLGSSLTFSHGAPKWRRQVNHTGSVIRRSARVSVPREAISSPAWCEVASPPWHRRSRRSKASPRDAKSRRPAQSGRDFFICTGIKQTRPAALVRDRRVCLFGAQPNENDRRLPYSEGRATSFYNTRNTRVLGSQGQRSGGTSKPRRWANAARP